MKTTVVTVLLILSLVAHVLLWRRTSVLETAISPPSDYPLGENMGYLQRYADKLWYAASAGNWDLARYYHDEIAETAEAITAAGVVKDEVDVSQDMKSMLPPALQSVSEAITARDPNQFRERYAEMVNQCNACHLAARHPFIHITLPAGPPAQWSQDFAGKESAP